MTRTILPRWHLAVLTLATLMAACDQPTPSAPTATSPPLVSATLTTTASITTTIPTTTAADVTQEVLAGYEHAWDVFATAMRTLDPAGLETAYAGSALATTRNQVLRQQATGRPVAIDVTRAPRVLSVAGDTAIVEDTYLNASVELDPDSGQPLGEVEPAEVREQRSLQRQGDGTWKVTLITRFEEQAP